MKKKVLPVLVVLSLILIVAVAGGVTMYMKRFVPTDEVMELSEYYDNPSPQEAVLVLNGEPMEQKGRVIDGAVYVDYETTGLYLNSRFYKDEEKGRLLFTTPEGVREITADSTEAFDAQGKPVLKELDGTMYLSLTYIADNSGIACSIYENPARAVIRNSWSNLRAAEVKEDGQVRYRGGIKSPILKQVKAGESLFLGENLDDWQEVRTEDGIRGYIESEKLGEAAEVYDAVDTDDSFDAILRNYRINMGWHQVTNKEANAQLTDILQRAQGMNVISPTWFSLTDNLGGIISYAEKSYVDEAHAAGLEVWGLIDNFNEGVSTLEVLSSSDARANLIRQLLEEAQSCGMDGINVDFEQLKEEEAPHYLQFLRELTLEAHKQQLVISVDNPVPQAYTKHYNRGEQGKVVDYVIIMGYDEHYSGGSEAGSVASLPFVENGIKGTLEEVPAEKVINAIPFYARLWTEDFGSGALSTQALGMDAVQKYILDHDMEVLWDDSIGQNVAEYETDEARYTIWIEDEASLRKKLELLEKYQLAGVAEWKLGLENSGIWEIIAGYLQY